MSTTWWSTTIGRSRGSAKSKWKSTSLKTEPNTLWKVFIEPISLNRMLRHSENGLISRTYNCADKLSRANCRASKVTMFETLEQFIDETTGFSDLVLDNFRFIFLYYFLFCSLVFVAFCVHHLFKFVKKNAFLIRSQLEFCTNLCKKFCTKLYTKLVRIRILFLRIGR